MGESARRVWFGLVGAAVVVILSGGCQRAMMLPGEGDSARWVGDEPGSMAFAPGEIQDRIERMNAELGPAWWETRRDHVVSVEAGYAWALVGQMEVYTYDRQSLTSQGRVSDYFHRQRRSVERGGWVR